MFIILHLCSIMYFAMFALGLGNFKSLALFIFYCQINDLYLFYHLKNKLFKSSVKGTKEFKIFSPFFISKILFILQQD